MKKGTEELMFVFSLILISLVLTLAFITFSVAGRGKIEEKVSAISSNEININLLNYLRTKDENNNTLSEIIVYSYYKKDYKNAVLMLENLIKKFHDREKCSIYYINAVSVKNNEKLFEVTSLGKANDAPRISTFMLIPTFDSQDNIKINYVEGCKNE